MAAAYATLANGGTYIEPTFYEKLVDANGETVVEPEPTVQNVANTQNIPNEITPNEAIYAIGFLKTSKNLKITIFLSLSANKRRNIKEYRNNPQ